MSGPSDPAAPDGRRGADRVAAQRSVRLTFRYDGTGVHLVRRTVRDKPAPRGDDLTAAPHPETVWAQVTGSDGAVLYRRGMRDAIPQSVEVFEPDGHIRAVPTARQAGVFTLVVPLDPGGADVVIVAGPGARFVQSALRAGDEGRPRELARVRLREG